MTLKSDIYGVIGRPVGHSLSPLMHNAAYRAMGLNALYLAFETENLAGTIQMIRETAIRGVSVTLPFKREVMSFLDEVDPEAVKIGAVNTITNEGGRLRGGNTDWVGLAADLENRLRRGGPEVAVIGAGGAARAAVFAVRRMGGVPIVANRTLSRGEALAEEFGCDFVPLSEIGSLHAAGLINATPLGMSPHVDHSPVRADILHHYLWVMDIVYHPLSTRLLREAGAAGCEPLSGLGMFVNQGAEQIRIWTGRSAPRELMRKVVLERLEGKMGSAKAEGGKGEVGSQPGLATVRPV